MSNRAKRFILRALEEKGVATTKELYYAVLPEFQGEQALSQGEVLRLLREMEIEGSIRSSVDKSAVVLIWELMAR